VIALLIAAAMLQTPAAPPAAAKSTMHTMPEPPVTIGKGDQSNVDEGKTVTVRTEAEWTRLWQQHNPDRQRPAIDFSKQMIVGVFMGSRNSAGFAVEIISAPDADGVITVHYHETIPARGSVTAQVITSPYHLVSVPKSASTVKFQKDQ
jgi:PrcB C-terminal